MREYLLQLLETSGGELSIGAIVLRLAFAVVIGGFIFLSYRLSHSGSIYSVKFNVSLVTLTVVTTTVMIVIGNNIALSLGMVGALSIVRFRTAIKDSRDTVYIFWAIVVGICCGSGDYLVASVGSAFVFLVLLFFQYFNRKAILRAKNTTDENVEFIYELSGKYLAKAEKAGGKSITDAVYEIGGIEYFNIVMQNDEISG